MEPPLAHALIPRIVPTCLTLAFSGVAFAVPLATDDSYEVTEDLTLNTESGPVISADFDTGSSTEISMAGPWDYLDRIENSEGAAQTYPIDGEGRTWNSADYELSTSSIGPWGTTSLPVQGGTIDVFPGSTPVTLGGIGSAPGGENLITTYLFRNTFDLTAAQAAETVWTANLVADDGCIIYINGVQVASFNMPEGVVNTETFAETGNESSYSQISLVVAGALAAGPNTIAVELHQSTLGSSDVGFDLTVFAGAGTSGGFVFDDDVFGTNQPDYAEGQVDPSGGEVGGGLRVRVGGTDSRIIPDPRAASGGFSQTFTLGSPATIDLSFRYRLTTANAMEQNEFGEAIFEFDGTRYGNGPDNSLVHINDGGDSGWQTAEYSFQLQAGDHTILLGAYTDGTSRGDEIVTAYFDDVLLTRAAGQTGGVLVNDTVGANATAVLDSDPSHGTLNFPNSGIFTYTPDPNYFGPDTFAYHARDDTGSSSPATVTIEVLPANDPPVAGANSYLAQEDTILLVTTASEGVLADDTDIELDSLTAVIASGVSNGSLTLNPNGTFSYDPAPDFFGTDSFTYRADDGSDQSAPATVTITVTGVPDPPAPQPDSYTAQENEPLVVTDGGGGPGISELVVDFGAEWRYEDTGTDLQTAWRARDFDDRGWASGPAELGYGDGDEATVVADGPNNNRHPTTYFRRRFPVSDVADISSCRFWIRRDDGCVVYLNGVQIGISNIGNNPSYGTYADNAGDDGNTAIEIMGVDPALFVEGLNSLAVEIHQGAPDSSDISFDLRMEVTRMVSQGLLANDTDPDGLPLTAVLGAGPGNGSVDLNPDGTFTYTPGLNYEGADSFTYFADNGNFRTEATVSLDVIPGPNDLPETQSDFYNPTEDTLYSRNAASGVLSNDRDPDDDQMTAALHTPPSHGTVTLNPDGSFTYIPFLNFFGLDSFTYVARDGTGESPSQIVTLLVSNTPDAPVAQPEEYATDPGQSMFVPFPAGVLANDSDPDRDELTAELVTGPASGTLNLFPNGGFVFTPANSTPGRVTFTYRAGDGMLTSPIMTVTIYLDTAPVANADQYSIEEDGSLAVEAEDGLLKNDPDAENDPLTAVMVSGPARGILSLSPDGSFTYEPEKDFHGSDIFTYLANDGPRSSAPAAVTITVTSVNDAPVAEADSYLAVDDVTLVVEAAAGVLANDLDVDSISLAAALETPPANGTLMLEADGSFSYEPAPGFIGNDSFTYLASDGILSSLPATVTIQVGGASDSIVINEIMYHPPSELDSHEFIELANIGDGAVKLGGWRFSSGLNFTFPEVSIPAGGYLVVAADPEAFTATYGAVPNLVGGWTGSLRNSGERLKLVDSHGQEVDDLDYSDQGDWAIRTRVTDTGEQGWVWESLHDGGGSSLELVMPSLTNKAGQNWLASGGAPTPGTANSVALPEAAFAPMILQAEHSPRVPQSTDSVTIRATLRDTSRSGLTATVHYRVSAGTPSDFLTTAMADDGLHDDGDPNDGLFGAVLPAMTVGTIIEYYLSATDGANHRTWPAPTSIGQVANALYQVDDEVHSGDEGIYRIIMTVQENARFNAIDRDSNAQMHCTLVADDCSGPVVRHSCGMRVRGASSRRDTPPPMRLNIPRDRPWNGTTSMNLNSQFTWLQFIGMKLFQASDLAAPDSKRVAVRRNGNDFATGDEEDYGSWVHLQALSGDLIDEKFPEDRQGNLYKKVRPDVDWAYRNGNYPRYAQDGWGKQTNESENDWTDLDEFLRVMNQAPGDNDYVAQVEAVANLDQWMRWFAVEALIANGETNASNGADDDYSIYRGVVDPRFVFLPHDLDTILGHGDGSRIANPEHTIFDMLERGDTLGPLVPLFQNAQIRRRYFQALRDLIQTSFSKERFDALVSNHLGGWTPQGRVNAVIAFMDARRAYITGLVNAELGAPPARPAPLTLASLPGPHGSLYISEVLADNASAHSNGGNFPDYLELHNAGGTPLSLAGYSLSDDPDLPTKFVIPSGTTIGAGQYLVIYADSRTGSPGIHLGFGFSRNGESVSLYNPAGTLLDSVVFGPQVTDRSIGRTGAGTNTWSLNLPTPGAANLTTPLGDPATLRINEWLSKPDLVFNEDFIELYNPDSRAVSLGGMAITDNPLSYPQRAVLPALSFIGPNGFAVFEAVGSDEANPNNSSELPFKLGSDYSWIAIYGSNGVEIDRVHAQCEQRDQSQGRASDGSPLFAHFALPTPGFSNATDLTAESRILQSLRITEIMYHPSTGGSDAEFIELRNIGVAPINLLGVSFTQGVDFDFPNLTLNPGQYVVVVANLAVFQSIYGAGVNVAGAWSGKLDNDEERIRLEIGSLNAAILDFTYRDFWYPSTDGGGYSLVIIDETADPGSWDLKASWTAGGERQGTPGVGSGFFVFAGVDQVVNLPAAATLNATVLYGALDPQTVSLTWSLENGPAAVEFGNPANEDTTVTVPMAGRYTFELIATPQAGPVMSGLVTVTFRDTYANWATVHFGSPLDLAAGKLADDDRDGFSNLLEFVLGLDPNVVDPGNLLQPTVESGGFLTLTYFRRHVEEGTITMKAEVSSDLHTWQQGPAVLGEIILASTVDGDFIQATDLFVPDGTTPRFIRLRVTCSQ